MFDRFNNEKSAIVPSGIEYDRMIINPSNQDHQVPVDRTYGLPSERNDTYKEKKTEPPDRPNRHGQLPTRSDSSDNNKRKRLSSSVSSYQNDQLPVRHLYRMQISDDDCLGFLTPCPSIDIPVFVDKANHERIQISYIGLIHDEELIYLVERFCRYLFEKVFDNMNMQFESYMTKSTPLLLPCFLKKSNGLDDLRMESILKRDEYSFQNPSELNDEELYILLKSKKKKFCKPVKNANRFGTKNGFSTVEMKLTTKPNLDLLKKSSWSTDGSMQSEFICINQLRLAPLNQYDTRLLYKMLLARTRIAQLYWITNLKQKLTNEVLQTSTEVEKIPIEIPGDRLPRILSSSRTNILPLESLIDDQSKENSCSDQLPLDLLLQAVTRRSTIEIGDMENLETLGDSFLKLIISLSVYRQHPFDSVGKLTSEKDKEVSNPNLGRLAKQKGLDKYLYLNEIKYEGTQANWISSGFYVGDKNEKNENLDAFADMVEALIGYFLFSTNYATTTKFLDWLGLNVITKDDHGQIIPIPSVLNSSSSSTRKEIDSTIETIFLQNGFSSVENVINYTFRDKAYLIAAFTHPSVKQSAKTITYQRLKFIGNSVLEFLVTRYSFLNKKTPITPGGITYIRKDALDEYRKDIIMVKNQLHKHIICNPPNLISDSVYEPIDKNEEWDDLDAPTSVSDVFDALFGAVFFDSNCSLQAVWNVFIHFYQHFFDIHGIIEHPTKNVVELFHERKGKLSKTSKNENGIFECHAILPNRDEAIGFGKSKKRAEKNACKKLLK